jgi:3,4-dihydroxy 2-butanone 4-phosphate synthase / GTP cyclohydrolase II
MTAMNRTMPDRVAGRAHNSTSGDPVDRPVDELEIRLDSIEDIIADYREGRMVILVDDEDRENEGDLLIAAEKVRAEDINFMARFGRGLICLALTEERCRQLRLPLMVNDNNARYSTNFTVSIEAAEGVTTGISAADRAATVLAAVRPDAKAGDVISPGHIFPLMALAGGVLNRAGHTEAGIDLARLAGLEPASVLCEVLKDDGSMARLPELVEAARRWDIRIGTIADLIRYRLEHEPTVTRVAQSRMDSEFGELRVIAYNDVVDNETHIALVRGTIDPDAPVPVRVHAFSGLHDVLAEVRRAFPWPIQSALRYIAEHGSGVLVLVRYEDRGSDLVRRIRDYQLQDAGIEFPRDTPGSDLRMLGVGAQILADLGVRRMRVLGTPKNVHALSGFGLEIVEYVSDPGVDDDN